MGINSTRKQARLDFNTVLSTFRADATNTRNDVRNYVGCLLDAANEWLAKRDAQDTAATADFAASKQAQFKTFVDALPDVTVDPNA